VPRNIAEFDRNAVITIQGGGVYALTLLGQLEGVVKDRDIIPLALAGTSAGAIVATLFWGMQGRVDARPRQIRDEVAKLAPLTSLLGPYDKIGKGREFDYTAFSCLKDDVAAFATSMAQGGLFRKIKSVLTASSLKERVIPHALNRGFFKGLLLEKEVDRILRQAPDIAALGLPSWPDGRVKFQHYHETAEKDVKNFRPPLFIVATNLSTKKVEVFSSLDDRCRGVAVAQAVRASAGFPVFFRPTDVRGGFSEGWYIDGGVVSNFPSWVFAEGFRPSMAESEVFEALAMRHWVHVGLRVVDDIPIKPSELEDPSRFFSAFVSMMSGSARNELDEKLAERLPRSIIVSQPQHKTDGPISVLDFDKMDSGRISLMFNKGSEFAEEELEGLSFKLPEDGDKQVGGLSVAEYLKRLVDRVKLISGVGDNLLLRSNIYIPNGTRLVISYSVNMTGDSDENLIFSRTDAGLTGVCFSERRPAICNLEQIGQLAKAGTLRPDELFNMTPGEHELVKTGRTWLASVPIFDPFDSSYRASIPPARQRSYGRYYYVLPGLLDGAILGVLNLDVDWSYEKLNIEKDPERHYGTPKIAMILDMMQQTALQLGRVFGAALGRRKGSEL
jgi:predicted acylesterase/phospholipase RssA